MFPIQIWPNKVLNLNFYFLSKGKVWIPNDSLKNPIKTFIFFILDCAFSTGVFILFKLTLSAVTLVLRMLSTRTFLNSRFERIICEVKSPT